MKAVFRRNGSGGSHFNEPSGYIFGERVCIYIYQMEFDIFEKKVVAYATSSSPSLFITQNQPAPLGKRRVREDWELVYYWGMFGSMGVGLLLYIYNPNDSYVHFSLLRNFI